MNEMGGEQETHAKSAAESWVENHEETIIKTRKEVEKLEAKLVGEEAEFEEIRDSLKGSSCRLFHPRSPFPS